MPPITGQIKEILQDITADSENESFVLLDVFQVNAMRHEFFGMPILSRQLDEVLLVLIRAKVLCHFNLCLHQENDTPLKMSEAYLSR